MTRTLPPVAAIIHRGDSISSGWHGMTDACRRWLAREVKAGRVYRRKGLRDGFRPFANRTYWISANRARDLDAECSASAAKLLMAASFDEVRRGDFANAFHLASLAKSEI